MKLGEIKIQALALMYPDAPIRYNNSTDEEIENAVYELKSSHNFEYLIEASVSAINRAFSIIESYGLSNIKCVDKAKSLLEKTEKGIAIDLEKDFVTLERVLCHKNGKAYAVSYLQIGNRIYTDFKGDVYTVVYRAKIPRATTITRDSCEVDLPMGLCEAIPYFVMAELIAREDTDRSREAREQFYRALENCEKKSAPCHQCFQIIYSME